MNHTTKITLSNLPEISPFHFVYRIWLQRWSWTRRVM